MKTKSRRSLRKSKTAKRNTRRSCVRSFSPLMNAKNASLFCKDAWMRNQPNTFMQIAGAMPNTLQLFLASPNASIEDRTTLQFLWRKFVEFREQQHVGDKRFIADAIWSLIQNIQLSYKNKNFVSMQNSPKLLSSMTYLFDEIVADFEERVENPVKSCTLLPGKFGRPAACPEKNSSTLQTCISEFTQILKEAKRLRLTAEKNPSEFIQKVLQFFSTVQASPTCLSFTRIDNFAKNKGKYTSGNLKLFSILSEHYLGNVYESKSFKTVNSNNRASTVSNASSVSAFNY
jgi:hypothetical protein